METYGNIMHKKITVDRIEEVNIVYNRRDRQGPGNECAQQGEGHHLVGARFGQVERREEEGKKVT